MLDKPKVLNFHYQWLCKSQIVTESNPKVLCNGICSLWGKWGTECFENFPVFFKEEYTSSNFTNEGVKSFPC